MWQAKGFTCYDSTLFVSKNTIYSLTAVINQTKEAKNQGVANSDTPMSAGSGQWQKQTFYLSAALYTLHSHLKITDLNLCFVRNCQHVLATVRDHTYSAQTSSNNLVIGLFSDTGLPEGCPTRSLTLLTRLAFDLMHSFIVAIFQLF